METKMYLKITLHDNDFTNHYEELGKIIQDFFVERDWIPSYDDLKIIRIFIAKIWHSLANLNNYYKIKDRNGKFCETDYAYFINSLEIALIDYKDISETWNNSEDIYIPLFNDNKAKIFCL